MSTDIFTNTVLSSMCYISSARCNVFFVLVKLCNKTWKILNQVLFVRGSLVVEVTRGAGLSLQIVITKGRGYFLQNATPLRNSFKKFDSIRVTNPRLLIFHCRLGEVLLCYAVPCHIIIAPTPETTPKIAKRPDSSKSDVSRKRKTRR